MQMAQASEMAQAREEAAQSDVVVYVTSWCAVCEQARAHLDAKGVSYYARDIEKDAAAFEAYQALGGTGAVPYFVIGGETMSGFNAQAIDARLAALGL